MSPAEFAAFTEGAAWRLERQRDLAVLSGWCSEAFARWKGRLPSMKRALELLFAAGEAKPTAAMSGARRVHLGLRNLARAARRRKSDG